MTGPLVAWDPTWPALAAREAQRWHHALGETLLEVHHVGSTSVAGLIARPVIDLLPIVTDLAALDARRETVEEMGYAWLGAYGLPGRRYCRRDHPATGRRLFQAHCHAADDPGATRHLAFRDLLRADPGLAAAYAAEKRRCARLHPTDGRAYGSCKSGWIDRVEALALRSRCRSR